MFKPSVRCFLFCIAVNASYAAINFVDNFDSDPPAGLTNSGWSPASNTTGAALTQNSGVFEFTGSYTYNGEVNASHVNNIELSAAGDWTVSVDMHIDALSSFGSAADFAGLVALNTLEISNADKDSHERVEFNTALTDLDTLFGEGGISHGYRFASYDSNGSQVFDDSTPTFTNDSALNATIYLSYDADLKQITADLDTGSGIQDYGSIVDTSSWTFLNGEFVIRLRSSLGPNTGTEPVLANTINIDSGEMYYDNFSLTTVPEPACYALLLGSLSLGIIGLRRQR